MNILRVAIFSAIRQIRRASLWTTLLTIFIMALTFLNMVVVTGILVGLVQGSSDAARYHYSGDVLISNNDEKSYIEETKALLSFSRGLDEIEGLSARFAEGGTVEANYKERTDQSLLRDEASATIVGINPDDEDVVTEIKSFLVAGSFINEDDEGEIVIGSGLLEKYSDGSPDEFSTIENADVGTKVRISINGFTKEVTIKGIVDSKVDEIERRVFFPSSELRKIIGRSDLNVDEIAIKLKPGVPAESIRDAFIQSGIAGDAKVETWEEAQGEFLEDIKGTFSILGTALGSLAVVVAAITIFIVIFINALNRKKFIGIQKAIGIHPSSITLSYVLQAIFYALIGISISAFFVFSFLEPYFQSNPIDFPFSDGILAVTTTGSIIRAAVLLVTTFIAGYVPAKLIVRGNTLDAMLGR